jgi:hypothetical protein
MNYQGRYYALAATQVSLKPLADAMAEKGIAWP